MISKLIIELVRYSFSRMRLILENPIQWKKKKKLTHSASVAKLLKLAVPDTGWMVTAFLALLIAAVGQSMIPCLTGQIINIDGGISSVKVN